MMNNSSKVSEWELRPGGMLVHRRDCAGSDHRQYDASGPTIEISVSRDAGQHVVHVPPTSTFGDLKKVLALEIGLDPAEQKLLFRGQEREDTEELHTTGLKDKSKVVLLQNIASKETQVQQTQYQPPEDSPEMLKALVAIDNVRAEVDKLSERVSALGTAVKDGTKVSAEEFDVSAELLMRQLLKLDGIEAEGEARLQRKTEVCRIQHFHEILDNLKARNSSSFSKYENDVSMTTEWETFESDSGAGSLTPPPPSSSATKVTQEWEKFD